MRNRVSQIKEELLSEARARTNAALINEDAIIDRYNQGAAGIPTQSEDPRFYKSSNPRLKEDYTETPEETELLNRVLESVARLSRIEDLGDFYNLVPVVKTNNTYDGRTADIKKRERQQVMEGSLQSEPFIVDGKAYDLERYTRAEPTVEEFLNTPAAVFREKQLRYPEKYGLKKIEKSQSTPDDSLISMLLADARRDDVSQDDQMTPVINMEVQRRAAPADLDKALRDEGMLLSGPLKSLRTAGMSDERTQREIDLGPPIKNRTSEQKNDIRDVLIGDMDRGYNPRTGAPYGSPFEENGVEVRDVLNDGHGYDFENFPLFANQPWNNAMELESENKGTSTAAKPGYEMPISRVFQARLEDEMKRGKDLKALRQRIDYLAAAGLLDQRRVTELINDVLNRLN